VVGLGGRTGGMPREEGFVISAASEVMAILGLADGLEDLQRRLGAIVVGFSRDGTPVRASDIGAGSPMAALLADALRPNLAHTRAGTPAIVHAGPFANIAHGTSSILGTRFALAKADVVVTEAGFGADLGAEKFIDLVAPVGGFAPDAVVVVATVKALAYHGGADKAEGPDGEREALERGLANLGAHLDMLARTGVERVVGLNRFADDSDEAIERVRRFCEERGVPCAVNTAYRDGAEGARALAETVLDRLAAQRTAGAPVPFYAPGTPTLDALERVARDVYGAQGVVYERGTRAAMRRYAEAGYGSLPVCVAKTQYSFTDDASVRNVPTEPWRLHVRELRLSAGAGFVVAVTGEIMTMPGLPKVPQAVAIGVTPTGEVVGIR
jgi:formate--tetrahydrofolate ligase